MPDRPRGSEMPEPPELRWSLAPGGVKHTGTQLATPVPLEPSELLLFWTEHLEESAAVALWEGLGRGATAEEREAAAGRWLADSGVQLPPPSTLRDLVRAADERCAALLARASDPPRLQGLAPEERAPLRRALVGLLRAREDAPGRVLHIARALAALEAPAPRSAGEERPPGERDSGPRDSLLPEARAHAPRPPLAEAVAEALRRRLERAPMDELPELLELWMTAQAPSALPPWALVVVDFLLVEAELRGAPPRCLARLAQRCPEAWTALLRTHATPQEGLRALRLLGALAAHEDIARSLGPLGPAVDEVLMQALEHPRATVWTRAARALGRLAGVFPRLAARLERLLEPSGALRRRAVAALGSLSPWASVALLGRRRALLDAVEHAQGEGDQTLAALAVALPDLAAEDGLRWLDLARAMVTHGGPETWLALARALLELHRRDPDRRALLRSLARDLQHATQAASQSGDPERAERASTLAQRLVADEPPPTPSGLLSALVRCVAQDPQRPGLRSVVTTFAAELDAMVAAGARAASQEDLRASTRGAMVLEETVELLVDGDLHAVAARAAQAGGRGGASGLVDALRDRLLRTVNAGLRRPTPAALPWRRWLLRTAALLPRISAGEELLFETLERVTDDPLLLHPGLLRQASGAVTELADALRPRLGARARTLVALWMAVRGTALGAHPRLRRLLVDEGSREALEAVFTSLEALGRPGRDGLAELRALATLVGEDGARLGMVLGALAEQCEAVASRRPEVHWSGLPSFDLTDLATAADTVRRVREDASFALTRDLERVDSAAGEALAERAGKLNRTLTATSLTFLDAARRAEVVEHYMSELGLLCEAIATACGPAFGAPVRGLLARALVAVRAEAASAVKDREEHVRYIARLKVLGELSSAHEGGMAATYLAEGPAPGKKVVVKLLPWTRFKGHSAELARAMFEGEMKRLASIVHPNVVSIFDAGFVEDGAYIALEYIPGGSLETLLRVCRKLPLAYLAPLVRDTARALGHLHRLGIVHRDIKPGNILVQVEGPDSPRDADGWLRAEVVRAVVIDFGIAADAAKGSHGEGVTGTPGYIAPEVARGLDLLTPAIDVYALGVVVFEMLTGINPYLEGQADLSAVLVRHGTQRLPVERLTPAHNDPELSRLLADATAADPRRRPTIKQFLERWARFTGSG
ncbi:MAG: serine/threonine protein kinase [Deltaproteobacteria bacterium]|nr:serine/threonine protein kinase [Deltaproteobacteria bacterium]